VLTTSTTEVPLSVEDVRSIKLPRSSTGSQSTLFSTPSRRLSTNFFTVLGICATLAIFVKFPTVVLAISGASFFGLPFYRKQLLLSDKGSTSHSSIPTQLDSTVNKEASRDDEATDIFSGPGAIPHQLVSGVSKHPFVFRVIGDMKAFTVNRVHKTISTKERPHDATAMYPSSRREKFAA
jgi:hypothetical protein